jgi:hypothetical protein
MIQNMNPTTAKTIPIIKRVLEEKAAFETTVRGSICPPVPCKAQSGQATALVSVRRRTGKKE